MDFVCVKITGLNLIRIVNRLVEKNVCVNHLVIKPKFIKFVIAEKDLLVLDEICKKEHKFYQIIYKNGFKQLFLKIPYMFGAILASLIITIYFVSISLFIKSVDVEYKSNNFYDLSYVNQLLKDKGIVAGMRKSKFSISEIQKLIMLEVDSVEGCEVRLNGNNLSICIYPATLKYEVETENLYSKFDGVVTFAEAYSGNLKVQVGDTISKGDLLIENNNGASGKILAKVYFSSTKIYNENRQELQFTGQTYTVKDFLIYPKFWIFGNNNCIFSKFVVEKRSFYVSKNLFLPILCQENIYREVEIIEKTIPFDEVKEKIKDDLLFETKQKISNFDEISNITYSIVTENNYTRIDCFVEAIVQIV